MDYLKKILPFSSFGLILMVIALSEFNSNANTLAKLLSVYLGTLGLICFITSFLIIKRPQVLIAIKFTIINVIVYLLFSLIFALFVIKSLVLAGYVLLFNIVIGVLLKELYFKAEKMMDGQINGRG